MLLKTFKGQKTFFISSVFNILENNNLKINHL